MLTRAPSARSSGRFGRPRIRPCVTGHSRRARNLAAILGEGMVGSTLPCPALTALLFITRILAVVVTDVRLEV